MAAPKQLDWLNDIPRMVKTIRQKLGLNPREFAKACKVHRTYISMLESGKRTPSMGVLKRIQQVASTLKPKGRKKR